MAKQAVKPPLTFKDLRHSTDLEFKDISNEEIREYIFPYPKGKLTIYNPIAVAITKSGSHRVLDAQGWSYRVDPSFISVSWKSREGKNHFAF